MRFLGLALLLGARAHFFRCFFGGFAAGFLDLLALTAIRHLWTIRTIRALGSFSFGVFHWLLRHFGSGRLWSDGCFGNLWSFRTHRHNWALRFLG